MLKNNGYTLAEVLITIAIIGVVATLVMPSLMAHVSEQQSMTAYKKILNTLNAAGNMNAAQEGFDFSVPAGTLDDQIQDGEQTLGALFNERLQVDKNSSGAFGKTGYCRKDPAFVLRDGTAICPYKYYPKDGFWIICVDTNGTKGPNLASTCGDKRCKNKSKRLIYDQYAVTLYRSSAIPGKWSSVGVEKDDKYTRAAKYAMGVIKRTSSD